MTSKLYVPAPNAVPDDELRAMVRAFGTAELITTAADGYPRATLLPIVWRGDTVIAHFARANSHWRDIAECAECAECAGRADSAHSADGTPALLVCGGPQAYVSPSWYASKAEHGRVVPTWNYSTVHLTGRARRHDDPQWLLTAVTELTRAHEDVRDRPWQVTDAPSAFTAGQLRGIVGVEFAVERAEGKAKLSQNRSVADRRGVVDGLRTEPGAGAADVAAAMDPHLQR